MVRVWVASKTVWSPCYTRAIFERFRDKELIYKALYKFAYFYFTSLHNSNFQSIFARGASAITPSDKKSN